MTDTELKIFIDLDNNSSVYLQSHPCEKKRGVCFRFPLTVNSDWSNKSSSGDELGILGLRFRLKEKPFESRPNRTALFYLFFLRDKALRIKIFLSMWNVA